MNVSNEVKICSRATVHSIENIQTDTNDNVRLMLAEVTKKKKCSFNVASMAIPVIKNIEM